jgi:hypothetical protein
MVLLYISIPIMVLALAIATVPLMMAMRLEARHGHTARVGSGARTEAAREEACEGAVPLAA